MFKENFLLSDVLNDTILFLIPTVKLGTNMYRSTHLESGRIPISTYKNKIECEGRDIQLTTVYSPSVSKD